MAVFRITLTSTGISGKQISLAFDAPFATVDEFTEAAATSYLIAGDWLTYAEDGRGDRLITHRERTSLGVPAIATVKVDRYRYWEPAE